MVDLFSFIAAASIPPNIVVLSTKMVYSKLQDEIKDVVLNQGLYHVTSEENIDKILESGFLKPSSNLISLGRKKTFFFAGAPDYDTLMQNVASTNTYEFSALKVGLSEEQLANYKVRKYSDNAIVCNGKCMLDDKQVEKVSLVLDIDEKGNIFSREKEPGEQYTPKQELIDRLNLKQTKTQGLKNLLSQTIKSYGRAFSAIKQMGSDALKKITNKDKDTKLLNPGDYKQIKEESWKVSDKVIHDINQVGIEAGKNQDVSPKKELSEQIDDINIK